MKQSEPLICSLGVFAYNEAGNILALLEALTSQELRNVKIAEIIVVSSASTDGTDELVAEYSQSHPQVKLIRQARREGKSAAINLFLAQATSPYLVVISGDVIPAPRTIERLVSAFRDERIVGFAVIFQNVIEVLDCFFIAQENLAVFSGVGFKASECYVFIGCVCQPVT